MATVSNFYGVDLGDPGKLAAAAAGELVEVFELLKPKASKTPLIRIGGDIDGSYLVPDDLDGIAACFSPGVNRIKYFEDFLTDHYGIQSHMCDFTCEVDQFTTPLKPGMQTFVKKWLDVSPGEDNISLEDWLREHDVPGDLLLQMDIEGAEYRNILATSEETLGRFRMVVLEVHGLGRMLQAPILRKAIAPFFQKLGRHFTTVHAHPNNCCGEFTLPGTDIRVPNVLELTLLRNDHFVPAEAPAALPHPLDVSRNVPRSAPLFLSEAWCDYRRPLESRVKILEDTLRYRDEVGSSSAEAELSGALSLTMQGLRTLSALLPPGPEQAGDLVEIAAGRPYELSAAYGTTSRTGVVKPRDGYFFHTEFGKDQSIRVDLGGQHPVRRIEVSNRPGHEHRARHIFAVLSDGEPGDGGQHVFPLYQEGPLRGGAWRECGIDLPDVAARYVTITSPMNTALHFSDLRIYTRADIDRPVEPPPGVAPRRALESVQRQLRRLPVRIPGRVRRPVRAALARSTRLTAAIGRARPPAGRG